MATLIGSEKQVAWAESIRCAMISAVEKANDKLSEKQKAAWEEILEVRDSAAWWIDRRSTSPKYLIYLHRAGKALGRDEEELFSLGADAVGQLMQEHNLKRKESEVKA